MKHVGSIRATLVLLSLTTAIHPATAAWPHDPGSGNVAVCALPGDQFNPTSVSDGAGGTIVTWGDFRSGNTDVYAQRLSAAGVPLWTVNGVALCTATGNQFNPTIVSDGAGGAIVTWNDLRSGTGDIYAQRISPGGTALWTPNGVALCAAAFTQRNPTITSDGAGGAIVTWSDGRGGAGEVNYTQRINAAGTPAWTPDGVATGAAGGEQLNPTISSDGAGGAIITWQDSRGLTGYDIYVRRINAAGVPQWTANGVALCTLTGNQDTPSIISDGAGGAFVTWEDLRSGTDYDIFAQHISSAGSNQWAANGVAISAQLGDQALPAIIPDDAGGAIITWQDSRSGLSADIYAQRINAAGATQWIADGVALCAAADYQYQPRLTPDGAGGAIVTWSDFRNLTNFDLYAQRISSAGTPQWLANGVALCTVTGNQSNPAIVSDGAGGAIVSWQDTRTDPAGDIYAQRIGISGLLGSPEPAILSVSDVRNDQGGFVKLTWSASYLDVDPVFGVAEYRVFRSVPGPFAAFEALRRGATTESDVAVRDGRLLVRPTGASVTSWEFVGSQAAETFALYSQVVATTADSVAGSNPRTWFMVEARATTALSSPRWFSSPDSGYSVDNLPPAVPAPFTGQYAAGTASLHWNRNLEADLAGYRLYRGTSAAFVPGPGTLVNSLPDTGYTYAAGAPYIYKLTAIDSHGNESPVATLVPSGTLGVGDGPPLALSFAAPSPNPARGATALEYTLSRAGHVRLSVYDAAGRRVQVLRDAEMAAGTHRESFALRDDAGRGLASGLYLLRLEAEGRVLTRRLATIR